MKPRAIHRQLDRCDICGRKVHIKDLVRTEFNYLRPAGTNYFDYSYYDGTFWVEDGNITQQSGDWCVGPDGEDARVKISLDNTTTEVYGSKTFLLDSSPAIIYTASSVDISGWTNFCLGVYVGQYHQNEDPAEISVEIGNCNSDASTTYSLATRTTRSMRHCWVTANVADLDSNVDPSSTYWYVKITASSDEDFYFFIDWMQLEKDAARPGAFISTAGATEDLAAETRVWRVQKTCKRHREPLFIDSEKYGRPRQEVELPIDYESQEI